MEKTAPCADVQWWSYLQDSCEEPTDESAGQRRCRGLEGCEPNAYLLGEEETHVPSYDSVHRVAEELGFTHPYLLSDVEIYNRESCFEIRDDLHRVCKDLWHKESLGADDIRDEVLPLPKSPHFKENSKCK